MTLAIVIIAPNNGPAAKSRPLLKLMTPSPLAEKKWRVLFTRAMFLH